MAVSAAERMVESGSGNTTPLVLAPTAERVGAEGRRRRGSHNPALLWGLGVRVVAMVVLGREDRMGATGVPRRRRRTAWWTNPSLIPREGGTGILPSPAGRTGAVS